MIRDRVRDGSQKNARRDKRLQIRYHDPYYHPIRYIRLAVMHSSVSSHRAQGLELDLPRFRKRAGVSLEQIAQSTKIGSRFLRSHRGRAVRAASGGNLQYQLSSPVCRGDRIRRRRVGGLLQPKDESCGADFQKGRKRKPAAAVCWTGGCGTRPAPDSHHFASRPNSATRRGYPSWKFSPYSLAFAASSADKKAGRPHRRAKCSPTEGAQQ